MTVQTAHTIKESKLSNEPVDFASTDYYTKQHRSAKSGTRRVNILRIGIPALGGLLIIFFIAWVTLSNILGETIGIAGLDLKNGEIVMQNPKLNGFTRSGDSYEVVAGIAAQDLGDSNMVRLEEIAATLKMTDGNIATIEAGAGNYHMKHQVLNLTETIMVETTEGYTMQLNTAKIDIESGGLLSDDPVTISTKMGKIEAGNLTVSDNGDRLFFDKRVKVTIQEKNLPQ